MSFARRNRAAACVIAGLAVFSAVGTATLADAQANQMIVVKCIYSPGTFGVYTIDLASKTVTDHNTVFGGRLPPDIEDYQATQVQISDGHVIFTELGNRYRDLNRYTLILTGHEGENGPSYSWQCQLQQKRF
ncbi:MAG: hypothetical protein ACREEB_06030 [Caulobacteraceae bacterium]